MSKENFDVNDDPIQAYDDTGVYAGKHETSLEEEGGKSQPGFARSQD